MKMNYLHRFQLILAGLFLLFSGCEDKCQRITTYTVFDPVYMTLNDFRTSVKSLPAQSLINPGKIYIKDNYLFVNELGKGIHVFDNSNPSAPQNISFINIPGNVDMAIKGNILYADSHIDLVAIDISNPAEVKVSKRLENTFDVYYRQWLTSGFVSTGTIDSIKGIIVEWKEREVKQVSECNMGNMWWGGGWVFNDMAGYSKSSGILTSASSAVNSPGRGGSTARFTISNNYLYAVDFSQLFLFETANASSPSLKSKISINGLGIETIFPYKNALFIGSQNGMFIFDNSDPSNPKQLSSFSHARACDPVVADDEYAYVTLRSVNNLTRCGDAPSDVLSVVDIRDLSNPRLYKTFPMEHPYGLGIDGRNLFICEGDKGLKRYDKTSVWDIDKNLKERLSDINAVDVIPFGNVLIVTGKDGIYQYDYSNPDKLKFLSKLIVSKS
jgi:hypothetical protein